MEGEVVFNSGRRKGADQRQSAMSGIECQERKEVFNHYWSHRRILHIVPIVSIASHHMFEAALLMTNICIFYVFNRICLSQSFFFHQLYLSPNEE